jgi:hypothetical protein
MRTFIYLILLTFSLETFTSCGINNNMLFKTPVDSDFSLDTLLNVPEEKSVIVPNDLKAIPLMGRDTRLMEVLASVGGIPDRGKASRIKLLRKYGNEWKVFMIDLSTVENLKFVDIIVRENDYIYVEPRPYILREILKESAPVTGLFTILSSTILLITVLAGK